MPYNRTYAIYVRLDYVPQDGFGFRALRALLKIASTRRGFSVATPSQRGKYHQMKRRLEIELDVITDLSPFELASKIEPLLQEAIETVKQTQETELELDIFLILDGREIRFVMEPV